MKIYHYEKELGLTKKFFFWDKDAKLNDKRQKIWKEQRSKYGFDEREFWSLKTTFAAFVYPRLKMFSEGFHSFPLGLSPEKWKEILDKMLYSFGAILKDESTEDYSKVEEGLDLFRQYFFDLWD